MTKVQCVKLLLPWYNNWGVSQFHFPARLKIKKEVLFKKKSNEPPATATKVGIIIAFSFLSHGNFGFSFYLPRTTRLLPPCNKEGITPPKRHVFRAKGKKRIPRNFVCERRSAQNSSSATFLGTSPPRSWMYRCSSAYRNDSRTGQQKSFFSSCVQQCEKQKNGA